MQAWVLECDNAGLDAALTPPQEMSLSTSVPFIPPAPIFLCDAVSIFISLKSTIGKFSQDGLSGVAWGQQWRELLTLEVLLSSFYCCARVGRRRARRNPTPRRDRDALRCLVFICLIILVFILLFILIFV